VVGGDLLGGRLVSARLLVQAAQLLLEHILLCRPTRPPPGCKLLQESDFFSRKLPSGRVKLSISSTNSCSNKNINF
jgi:hypothetical protein